jgi:hypothetical protein
MRDYILPELAPVLTQYRWVDLFAGKGDLIFPILEQVPPAERADFFAEHIRLYDIQPQMVAHCIQRAVALGVPEPLAREHIRQRKTRSPTTPKRSCARHCLCTMSPIRRTSTWATSRSIPRRARTCATSQGATKAIKTSTRLPLSTTCAMPCQRWRTSFLPTSCSGTRFPTRFATTCWTPTRFARRTCLSRLCLNIRACM